MNAETLQSIGDEVAKSLSHAMVHGRSAFITTGVIYPNGSTAIVRLDQEGDIFFVSDDGQANLNTETFGGARVFSKIAADVAKRYSVEYDQRSFFILQVRRNQLPAAVAMIANASATAVDRTIQAIERQRIAASKELFTNRITEAFGSSATFGSQVHGASREWDVDAAIISDNQVQAVFEFVTPAPASIAFAHMKIGDISARFERPKTIIVLADYEKTEAPMRQILSSSADTVVAVKSAVTTYREAA